MERLDPSYTAGGNVRWYSCFGTVWNFLELLNMELAYDPAIPLLGIYPKEMKTYVHRKTCTQMFIAILFMTVKNWKESKCPSTDEWVNKM